MSTDYRKNAYCCRGLTLIELIVFIMIVSVALVGTLSVLNISVFSSADPGVRKQMLAIAEAILEEVTAMPFTYCDPDDTQASTATGTAGCATLVEQVGTADGSESRGDAAVPFDNVNDYHGLTLNPVSAADGNNSYAGYSATVTITPEALNGVGDTTTTSAALRITVAVCHSTTQPCPATADRLSLQGYRLRHSPNALP